MFYYTNHTTQALYALKKRSPSRQRDKQMASVYQPKAINFYLKMIKASDIGIMYPCQNVQKFNVMFGVQTLPSGSK